VDGIAVEKVRRHAPSAVRCYTFPIVWVAISAATVADVAFAFTVALAAAVVIAVRSQDVDPDELAAVATSVGFLRRWSRSQRWSL
jgi:hypothetical protein